MSHSEETRRIVSWKCNLCGVTLEKDYVAANTRIPEGWHYRETIGDMCNDCYEAFQEFLTARSQVQHKKVMS